MGEDGFGQWQIQRHQHGGPVDGMGGENVFPNEMNISRPKVMANRFLTRQIFQRRNVIDQRVEPDVGDVVRIEGEFDAPGKSGFWSGDRQVA